MPNLRENPPVLTLCCAVCCCILPFVAAEIAYLAFAILAITDYNVGNACASSNIRAFCIYTVVNIASFSSFGNIDENKKDDAGSFICGIVIEICKVVVTVAWGYYELFAVSCVDNKSTIWKICYAYWISAIALFVIILCLAFGYCMLGLLALSEVKRENMVLPVVDLPPPPPVAEVTVVAGSEDSVVASTMEVEV